MKTLFYLRSVMTPKISIAQVERSLLFVDELFQPRCHPRFISAVDLNYFGGEDSVYS